MKTMKNTPCPIDNVMIMIIAQLPWLHITNKKINILSFMLILHGLCELLTYSLIMLKYVIFIYNHFSNI